MKTIKEKINLEEFKFEGGYLLGLKDIELLENQVKNEFLDEVKYVIQDKIDFFVANGHRVITRVLEGILDKVVKLKDKRLRGEGDVSKS